MKISDLTPAEYNPRIITEKRMDMLGKAMAVFGDLSGIIYNRSTGRLIGGHQRIKILDPTWKITTQETSDETGTVAVGHIETPAGRWLYREVEWDEQKEKLANIASNKHGGEFDWVKLKDLIVEIDDGAFDLELTGFTESELADVFGMAVEPKAGLTDDDALPETPAIPNTQAGDLYLMGDHRLLCGDSTSQKDVTRLMDGDQPVLMVTDPPYGVEYDPMWRAEAGMNVSKGKMGKVMNDDRVDWSEAYRLFTGDVAYIYHAGKYTAQVSDSIKACGYDIRSQIIWVKDRFALSRSDYHWQHEPCWYAVRQGKPSNWNGAPDQTTTWRIARADDGGHGHGTQKPVECMAIPIRNNSRAGDIIYDPFTGSGSTLIACQKLQRQCRSMELDPKYCDIIVKRWEDFTGEKATRVRAGEFDAE